VSRALPCYCPMILNSMQKLNGKQNGKQKLSCMYARFRHSDLCAALPMHARSCCGRLALQSLGLPAMHSMQLTLCLALASMWMAHTMVLRPSGQTSSTAKVFDTAAHDCTVHLYRRIWYAPLPSASLAPSLPDLRMCCFGMYTHVTHRPC
jgi:hypothetical protein